MPRSISLIALAALGGAALAGGAQAGPQAPHARLSMAQARAIALRAAPGRIIKSELEKEKGGWRYSFDIQQRRNVQEIGVDAASGRVVENKSEGKVDHD